MSTVDQPTPNPTRKLSAAMVAGAVVAIARAVLRHFAPDFDDPEMWIALTPLVILAAGYVIRDKPNVAP